MVYRISNSEYFQFDSFESDLGDETRLVQDPCPECGAELKRVPDDAFLAFTKADLLKKKECEETVSKNMLWCPHTLWFKICFDSETKKEEKTDEPSLFKNIK